MYQHCAQRHRVRVYYRRHISLKYSFLPYTEKVGQFYHLVIVEMMLVEKMIYKCSPIL